MTNSVGSVFLINSVIVFMILYAVIVPYAKKVEVQLNKGVKVEFEAEAVAMSSFMFLLVRGILMLFPFGIGALFSDIVTAAILIALLFVFGNRFFRWLAIEVPELLCGIFLPLLLTVIVKNLPYIGVAYTFIVGLLLK